MQHQAIQCRRHRQLAGQAAARTALSRDELKLVTAASADRAAYRGRLLRYRRGGAGQPGA